MKPRHVNTVGRVRQMMVLGGLLLGVDGPAASAWLERDRIATGGDGHGPLSAGLSNYPLGAAFVYAERGAGGSPDIFVAAGRFSHEPGLFLYRWKATAKDGAPVFGERVEVRQ